MIYFTKLLVFLILTCCHLVSSSHLNRVRFNDENVQYVKDGQYRSPLAYDINEETASHVVSADEAKVKDGLNVLDIADADGNKIVYIKNFPHSQIPQQFGESKMIPKPVRLTRRNFQTGSTYTPLFREAVRPVLPQLNVQYGYPLAPYALPFPMAFTLIQLPQLPVVPFQKPAISNPVTPVPPAKPSSTSEQPSTEPMRDTQDPFFGGYPGGGFGYPGGILPGVGYPGGGYPGGIIPGGGYPGGIIPGIGYPGGGYPGGILPGVGYPGGGYPGIGYPGVGYPGVGYPGGGYPGVGYPGIGYPGIFGSENAEQKKPNHSPYPHDEHRSNEAVDEQRKFESSPITNIKPATEIITEENVSDQTKIENSPVEEEKTMTVDYPIKDTDPKSVITKKI